MKFEKNNKLKNRIRDKRKFLMKNLGNPENARDLVFTRKIEQKTFIEGITTLLNFGSITDKGVKTLKLFVTQAKCKIHKNKKGISVHLFDINSNKYIQSFSSITDNLIEGAILGYEFNHSIYYRVKLTKIESIRIEESKKIEERINFWCKPKHFFFGKESSGHYDRYFIKNIKTPICKGGCKFYTDSFSKPTRASLKEELYNMNGYIEEYLDEIDPCRWYEYDWDPEEAWIEENKEYLKWKKQEEEKEKLIKYYDTNDLENLDIWTDN